MAGIDKNTLLLIHGDSFEDSSMYGRTIVNNNTSINSNLSKFGACLSFNGANSYICTNESLITGNVDFIR